MSHQQQRHSALPSVYRNSLSASTGSESSSPHLMGSDAAPSSRSNNNSQSRDDNIRHRGDCPPPLPPGSLVGGDDGSHMYSVHHPTHSNARGNFIASPPMMSPSHAYQNTPVEQHTSYPGAESAATSSSYYGQQQPRGTFRYRQDPQDQYHQFQVPQHQHEQPHGGHTGSTYNRYTADSDFRTNPLAATTQYRAGYDRPVGNGGGMAVPSTPSSSTTNQSEASFHSQQAPPPPHLQQLSYHPPTSSGGFTSPSPYQFPPSSEDLSSRQLLHQPPSSSSSYYRSNAPQSSQSQLLQHQPHQNYRASPLTSTSSTAATSAPPPPPHPISSVGVDLRQPPPHSQQRNTIMQHASSSSANSRSQPLYVPPQLGSYLTAPPSNVPPAAGGPHYGQPGQQAHMAPPPPPASMPFHMHTHLGSGASADSASLFRRAPPPLPTVGNAPYGGVPRQQQGVPFAQHGFPDNGSSGGASPAASASPVGNSCFVGNIPPQISASDLEEIFASAAPAPIRPIARIHKDGRYAFVTLANFVVARQAADQLHGQLVLGRNIRVEVTQNVPRYVIQQALTHHHIQQHTQQHRATTVPYNVNIATVSAAGVVPPTGPPTSSMTFDGSGSAPPHASPYESPDGERAKRSPDPEAKGDDRSTISSSPRM